MSVADRQKVEDRREELRAQLSGSDKKWQNLLSEANRQINGSLTLQSQAVTENISINQRRGDIHSEIDKFEKERIETARLDHVRRIAARFYGAKPEEVPNDKVDFVSNVWFGSLALLAALAGPMTALVSLELQKLAEEGIKKRKASFLRRVFISWRWRRVRTIKVPVEIPIEKEVENRIEIPVEKIIK